jgi:hypothetical protein
VTVDLRALDVLSAEQVLRLAGGLEAAGTVTELSTDMCAYGHGFEHPHEVASRLGMLIGSLPTMRRLDIRRLISLADGHPVRWWRCCFRAAALPLLPRRATPQQQHPAIAASIATASLTVVLFAACTQTRPQGQESVWAVLALLRHLPLESLACSVSRDGEGLPHLAHSAPSLAPSLRSLTICSVSGLRRSSGVAAAPLSSSDLDFLGALTGLKSLLLFWTVAPASLSRLTALTRLHLHVCNLSPALVADRLAPLRGLRQLIFARWETPPTTLHALPACGSVTQLQCSLWHTGAASLAAAFPGVRLAQLSLLSEESAPMAPPPQPGAPRWSALRVLRLSGLRRTDGPSCMQMLQALGALGGALRSLSVWQPGDNFLAPWLPGDAELLAFLAVAPALQGLSLQSSPWVPWMRRP